MGKYEEVFRGKKKGNEIMIVSLMALQRPNRRRREKWRRSSNFIIVYVNVKLTLFLLEKVNITSVSILLVS